MTYKMTDEYQCLVAITEKENEINIEECEAYWQRMRDKGFWIDGIGWTEKAVKEWNK